MDKYLVPPKPSQENSKPIRRRRWKRSNIELNGRFEPKYRHEMSGLLMQSYSEIRAFPHLYHINRIIPCKTHNRLRDASARIYDRIPIKRHGISAMEFDNKLAASRNARMVNALSNTRLQDGYVAYRWDRRMQEFLSVPYSSCFLSLLLLPKASDQVASRYNDLEDTLARANAWLIASQASGVPVVFMNIQTESLLTKISGETASSTVNAGSLSDLSNVANTSLYGFEDYHGVDIGVVKAVRLWYAPPGGEYAIEIKLKEGDTKLGFAISRTEEGFIFISSVMDGDENAPSTRSGLRKVYKEATNASRLLVVSRVGKQKVLPWMVSSTGAIRCFDTVSLSQKLSLHRHAKVPILIHVFLWDGALFGPSAASSFRAPTTHVLPLPLEVESTPQPNENQTQPVPAEVPTSSRAVGDKTEVGLERDTAGELSFRFHNFSLSSNWV
ncbi:hypothetical protein CJ030_MR1G005699 [Morella rubra]|uniref:Uncharacterized protein n=1 Tax=Morella rubra TaxID=262757 RepID=A0A6A1WQY4_9ROSI|nr:hypothetical protein CJ030_MR5G023760 [Morella rubra]KAB1227692.1 hypothetical protein CJ030_MR1G005699 [Morella rubra]